MANAVASRVGDGLCPSAHVADPTHGEHGDRINPATGLTNASWLVYSANNQKIPFSKVFEAYLD